MARFRIIKLKSLTPLHIGTGRENYDSSSSVLHSDTLSSALAAIRAKSGKSHDVEAFLQSFALSSAFPFVGDRYFLPLPKGKKDIEVAGKEEHLYRKALKRLQYAEVSIWNRLAAGEHLKVSSGQIQANFYLTSNEKMLQPIRKAQVAERVSVPRASGDDASPFFFEWIFFNTEGGLFCLVDASDEVFKEIKTLFQILGEEGIGTDRNVGGGHFEVEEDEISLDTPTDANAMMSLGLYLPTKTELPDLRLSKSCYSLLLRGGFMSGSSDPSLRHLRKKSVYMFEEGSSFRTSSLVKGTVVDLTPDWNGNIHRVYRSGRTLVVPIKTNDL